MEATVDTRELETKVKDMYRHVAEQPEGKYRLRWTPTAKLWESSGLRIEQIRDNPYEFISDRARNASAKYGVKSVSLVAIKPSN
jgi:hypothetical protein